MKRRQLIAYLNNNGCLLLREGSKHSVYNDCGRIPDPLWARMNAAQCPRKKESKRIKDSFKISGEFGGKPNGREFWQQAILPAQT